MGRGNGTVTRNERQELILKLIAEEEIDTQEELRLALERRGIPVTQATISRDMRELDLIKVSGTNKKYRYAEVRANSVSPKMQNLFRECVVEIRAVNNLLLVKTLGGNASNAGMVVDQMELKEIAGTVAGDDTLLVVCESAEDAARLAEKLGDMAKPV